MKSAAEDCFDEKKTIILFYNHNIDRRNGLKRPIFAIETHVADARTCCLHPASATHRQLTEQELIDCGISSDLVRFSCGLEDAEDLIADIKQALDSI